VNAEDNKPFSTRLPGDARAKIRALAKLKGLKEGDIGRMFILEKLAEAESSPRERGEMRECTALTIAALSDSIDLEQARELVAQHLDLQPPVTQ